MRVGARTCAHVCVRTFLDVLAPKLMTTSLSVGYMHFTCALACAHYARTMRVRALHARARTHIVEQIISKIGGDIPWVTETYTAYLIFTRACVCTLCAWVHARARVCAYTHFWTYSLKEIVKTFLCMCYMLFTCALYACVHCTHVRAHTLLDGFSKKMRHSLGHRNLHGIIDFYVRNCVCTLCAWVHAHARMCAFAHLWTY
jgi:hypothetical protein